MDREVARNWPLQGCTNNSSTLLSLRHHCIKIVHYQRNTGCMWRWSGKRAGSCARSTQPPECGQRISAHLPGPCRLGLLGSSDRSDKNVLPWFPNPATRTYCLVSSSALKKKRVGGNANWYKLSERCVALHINCFQIVILFDTNNFTPKNLSQRNHQKWCQRLRY